MREDEYRKFCQLFDNPDYWEGAKLSNYGDYHPRFWERSWHYFFVDMIGKWINLLPHPISDNPRPSVLCAGAAFGFEVAAFIEHGWNAIGFDVSRYCIAQQMAPMFLHNVIDPIPLPDRNFDLVLSSSSIEHLPEEFVPRAFANLAKPAKRFILIDVPVMDVPCSEIDKDVSHLTKKSSEWWRTTLLTAIPHAKIIREAVRATYCRDYILELDRVTEKVA